MFRVLLSVFGVATKLGGVFSPLTQLCGFTNTAKLVFASIAPDMQPTKAIHSLCCAASYPRYVIIRANDLVYVLRLSS